MSTNFLRAVGVIGVVAALVGGLSCNKGSGSGGSGKQVVVYTAVDEEVARPILAEFEKRTGIKVVAKTDTEASKTSGLVAVLRAEKANPQADVWWNNEPFHSINLAEEGVLAGYDSPAAKDIPARFKDAKGRWAANGLRVRMIAMAPAEAGRITKMEDLVADPAKVKGKLCMGFPALGTIAGHLALLRLEWGPQRYEKYLRALEQAEVKLLGGNSEVVKQIALGNTLAGPTDNDDVDAINREMPGKVVGVPARTAEGGALGIPTTVSLVTGAKHDPEAKQLIDYLLSAEVEQKLIAAKYSLRSVRAAASTQDLATADYLEIAKVMKEAVDKAREILEGKK